MRIVPVYLPDTGATLTTAKIHSIVDQAQVYDLLGGQSIDVSQAGFLAGSSYTAALPSIQNIAGLPNAVFHTAASMYPAALYFGFAAGRHEMACYWTKRSGAGTQVLPKGWVVSIPRNDQVWADSNTFQGQEISDFQTVPYISGDPRIIYPHWTSSTGGGRGILPGDPCFICNQAVTDEGYTKVQTLGFTEALVHYSLSTSFSPGDLYALYHLNDLVASNRMRMPICWHGSNISGVTLSFLPYGIVRQVYTASGVTMVTLPKESALYSLSAQPFYVAKIWFWGQPCL